MKLEKTHQKLDPRLADFFCVFAESYDISDKLVSTVWYAWEPRTQISYLVEDNEHALRFVKYKDAMRVAGLVKESMEYVMQTENRKDPSLPVKAVTGVRAFVDTDRLQH